MAAERADRWRVPMQSGEDSVGPGNVGHDPHALTCPLIPTRMKYTCSGRCKGCRAETAPESAPAASKGDDGGRPE